MKQNSSAGNHIERRLRILISRQRALVATPVKVRFVPLLFRRAKFSSPTGRWKFCVTEY